MRLLWDLESDGLLQEVSKVWCIATLDIDRGTTRSFRPNQILEAIEYLSKAEVLIGHNIIAYDLPVMNKLYGWVPNATIKDTLVMSRTMYPNMMELDVIFMRKLQKKGVLFPPNLIGKHSLAAWGYRLNNGKDHYEDWTHFTEEMMSYCEQDIQTNFTLWEKLQRRNENGKWNQALELEHNVHTNLMRMEKEGVPFNLPAALNLKEELASRKLIIYNELQEVFPPKVLQLKTKEKLIPFNPGSRKQIGERLMAIGWKPKKLTELGNVILDEPTLDAIVETYQDKVPAVKVLGEYLMLSKRLGQLSEGKESFLHAVGADGKVHGRMNHMGCVTSRCSHNAPNMGQVVAAGSPYGKEFRSLFYAPEGYSFVGSDVSGLELRMLAHYMFPYDDGEYANEVLNGDIHTKNMKAAGLENRNQAKTFIYGFLYGAGAEKIGKIVGKGIKEGQRLIDNFLTATPALQKLRDNVRKAAERGYLKGLDGREIPVRHNHASLNTLLQGNGAIICKTWYNYICSRADGVDAKVVLYVHDEVQTIVKNSYIETFQPVSQEGIRYAQNLYNIRVQLDTETKTGNTWYATH